MSEADRAPIALILAAGQGTRMRSDVPKVLFPVLGRGIVQRVVDAARGAGCDQIVAVVGHGAEAVRAALPGIHFALQEQRRGTGDAVAAARGAMSYEGRTVLVLPGDVPLMRAETLLALIARHEASGDAVTVGTIGLDEPAGYGRVLIEGGSVQRIVEHKDASAEELEIREVNTSIYAFDGGFLFGSEEDRGALSRLSTDNAQGEYLLTDVVALARRADRGVSAFHIDDPWEAAGVNTRAQLTELEDRLRCRVNHALMEAGVTLEDPATTRIEESCRLGRDVTLGGGVELRGACEIAEHVQIGRGCVLRDVTVGPGCRLGPYVVATRVHLAAGAEVLPFSVLRGINEKQPEASSEQHRIRVGERARVGPFSHLRQGSELEAGVHVGNYVELKETRMREGAKANHLSYLGDAEVGAGSNIGAGVITCNYDGYAKHRTVIGQHAFVGVQCQLIAPLRIGAGAYVGTGTTVTKDVPADALAIGRCRQENKRGYGSRLRATLRRRAERKAAAESAEKNDD